MDLVELASVLRVVEAVRPDEIYNLAAQSFVGRSFEQPVYTADVDALGVTRLLEAIRTVNSGIRFYQASTSEMFGCALHAPQTEETPFFPRNPYGVAKLYAHWITKIYRDSYNIFACSGLLFNHESPRRGDTFVTKKITNFFANKINNKREILYLGNIYAKRDWGHSKDYVKMQWRMLQNKKPKDYVIATGKTTSVKNFINECCKYLKLNIIWEGKKLNEK